MNFGTLLQYLDNKEYILVVPDWMDRKSPFIRPMCLTNEKRTLDDNIMFITDIFVDEECN